MPFSVNCVENRSLRAQCEELATQLRYMQPDASILWAEISPVLSNVPGGLAASSITVTRNATEKTVSVEARWLSRTRLICWTFHWNRRFEIDPYTVEVRVNGTLIRYKISKFRCWCCFNSSPIYAHNKHVRKLVRKCIPKD